MSEERWDELTGLLDELEGTVPPYLAMTFDAYASAKRVSPTVVFLDLADLIQRHIVAICAAAIPLTLASQCTVHGGAEQGDSNSERPACAAWAVDRPAVFVGALKSAVEGTAQSSPTILTLDTLKTLALAMSRVKSARDARAHPKVDLPDIAMLIALLRLPVVKRMLTCTIGVPLRGDPEGDSIAHEAYYFRGRRPQREQYLLGGSEKLPDKDHCFAIWPYPDSLTRGLLIDLYPWIAQVEPVDGTREHDLGLPVIGLLAHDSDNRVDAHGFLYTVGGSLRQAKRLGKSPPRNHEVGKTWLDTLSRLDRPHARAARSAGLLAPALGDVQRGFLAHAA